MAKQINTRILLKYDSYDNWMASSFILKKGEAAICEMANTVDQSAAPTILVKFGDGSHSFSQLPWSSALAADVYAWAKADGIQTEEVLAEGASEADGSVKVFTGVAFNKDTSKLVFTYKYAAKVSDIKLDGYATKDEVNTAKQDAATDATTKANQALADAKTYTDTLANGQVKANKENIDALATKVNNLEVTGGQANVIEGVQVNGADLTPDANKKVNIDLANATVAKAGDADKLGGVAAADYATKTVAQGYADAKDTAIAAAKKAGTDAQAYAEGVAGRVATIEGDYLKAADKTALQEQITTNANAITALTEGLDPDKIDGVKDLINYVDEHGAEVTGMKEDIAANSAAIALAETKEDANQKLADAKAYTDEQVEAAKADAANGDAVVLSEAQAYAKKYADDNFLLKTEYKEYDDTALSGKVTALETAVGNETSGLVKDVADLEAEVAGLALGDKNVIESVKVNNTALEVTDKTVNIDLTGYRTTTDKITSDDLSDEVFIFNCGSATTLID